MQTFVDRLLLALWLLIFFFPFAILLLALLSKSAPDITLGAAAPLLFFYGLAIALTAGIVLIARAYFGRATTSFPARKKILKLIFLLPLLPGAVYFGMLIAGLFKGSVS